MPGPFQTIVRDEVATSLLRTVDRIGAWLAPGGSARLRAWIGAAVLAAIPVPMLAVDVAVDRLYATHLWLINLLVFDFFQMTFAWTLWRSITALAPDLDALVAAAPRDEQAGLLASIRRWHRPARAALAMAGGGLLAAGIAILRTVHDLDRPPSAVALVAIVVTGIIAGHSVYITVFGIWLLRALLSVSRMHVTWQAPINTPGLAGMSRVARRTAWLGLVLLALAQPPLIRMFLSAHSPLVTITYAVVFAIHVGLITASGIGAQVWISRRLELEKGRILGELSAQIEDARRKRDLAELHAYVDIHRAIDATAHTYLGSATVTQYVASLLAVVLQFGIPVLIR